MTKLLKREFADLLGCLPIVVSRLVKSGEVKTDINGKIDVSSKKMQDYIKNKKIEIQQHKEKITKKEFKLEKEIQQQEEQQQQEQEQKNKNETNKTNKKTFNFQLSTFNKNEVSLHSVEYETKQHKLQSEKYKAELLEMEVHRQKKNLIETDILNRIISKTIGTLSKNIIEIPANLVDEIIDIVKTEEEPKPLIVNLITKRLHKEIESTIDKTEKKFLRL